jgi:hypothetical protein
MQVKFGVYNMVDNTWKESPLNISYNYIFGRNPVYFTDIWPHDEVVTIMLYDESRDCGGIIWLTFNITDPVR